MIKIKNMVIASYFVLSHGSDVTVLLPRTHPPKKKIKNIENTPRILTIFTK